MELKELVQQTAELIKNAKNQWVESNPKNTDIAIYIQCYRDDELVVVVQCEMDREIALDASRISAAGFAADTMVLAMETYHSVHRENPITNKPWRPQEMQFVFQTYPEASEKGWVTECITLSAHERSGGYVQLSMPYRLHGTEVEWLETEDHTAEEAGEKVVLQFLQETMERPTIAELIELGASTDPMLMVMKDLVEDDEERLFRTDMATCAALQDRRLVKSVMVCAEPGSARAGMLAERLGEPDHQGQYPVS